MDLPNFEWAGTYIYLTLFDSEYLKIDSRGNYSYCLRLCGMLAATNYGKATWRDQTLFLAHVLPLKRLVPESLVPVRWGGSHYLVHERRMIGFCNDFNLGRYPDGFLRQSDREKPYEGWPEVPKRFEAYLLKKPIEAEVAGVEGTAPEEGQAVNINAGIRSGLLPGMRMVQTVREGMYFEIEITRLSEDHACGIIKTYFPQLTNNVPLSGIKVSTRDPWGLRKSPP